MSYKNDTWQFYRDKAGEYRWRRKAPNGEIVGASTEGYTSRHNAIRNAIRNGYTPNTTTMSNARTTYIGTVAPLAIQARAEYPALFPSLAIAQAVLESGNGRSELARTYHNHFGIKANKAWTGKVVSLKTKEVYDSKEVSIVDGFRAYDTAEDSFRDRNRFLARNRRYTTNGVFSATTPQEQAKALQRAGYATDPNYAKKLIDLIAGHGLEKYDNIGSETAPPTEAPTSNVVTETPIPPLRPPTPTEHPRPPIPNIPIPTPPPSKHSIAMRIFTALRNLLRK